MVASVEGQRLLVQKAACSSESAAEQSAGEKEENAVSEEEG